MDSGNSIRSMLYPKTILLTGATQNPEDVGTYVLRNIIYGGFEGKVFPINEGLGQVFNIDTYPNIESVSEEVDLAILASSHDKIADEVIACTKAQVHSICIVTPGFAETGHSGRILQKRLVHIASNSGIRVIGPNSLGIISTTQKLNASFGPLIGDISSGYGLPIVGNSVFMSQSGALINALLEYSKHYSLGLSELISLGNKADIDETEILEYYTSLRRDGQPQVIGAYLEGFAEPEKFLELSMKASQQFPFLLLTPLETEQIQEYVFSHSGSILQRKEFVKLAMRKAGILRVLTQQQLFDSMLSFAWQPIPRGNSVAIVSNAGSGLILAIDQFQRAGLKLVSFSTEVKQMLTRQIHWRKQSGGVVDLGGAASSLSYLRAIDIVLGDNEVNAALVILSPQGMTEIEESAEVIGRLTKQHGKTIICAFLGYEQVEQGIQTLARYHIPAFNSIDRAVQSLSKMVEFYLNQASISKAQIKGMFSMTFDRSSSSRAEEIIQKHSRSNDVFVGLSESLELISLYGASVDEVLDLEDKKDLEKLGKAYTFPVEIYNSKHGKKFIAYNRKQAEELLEELSSKEPESTFARKFYSNKKKIIISVAKDTYYEYITQGFTVRELQALSFGYALEIRSNYQFRSEPLQVLLPVSRDDLEHGIVSSKMLDEFQTDSSELKSTFLTQLVRLGQSVERLTNDFKQILSIDIEAVLSNQKVLVMDCRIRLDLMA